MEEQIWGSMTCTLQADLPGHMDHVYCINLVAGKVVDGDRDRVSKTQVLVNLFVVPLIALLVLFVVERIRCKGFGLGTWNLGCLPFGLRLSYEAETCHFRLSLPARVPGIP